MVKKIADLENFCIKLLDKGLKDIGLHKLKFEIAKEFGYSKFIHKTTFQALIDYGFIYDDGHGGFEIKMLKDVEDIKREAEKEVDSVLERIAG